MPVAFFNGISTISRGTATVGAGSHRISVPLPMPNESNSGSRPIWIRRSRVSLGGSGATRTVRVGVGDAVSQTYSVAQGTAPTSAATPTFRNLDRENVAPFTTARDGFIANWTSGATVSVGFNCDGNTNFGTTSTTLTLANLWGELYYETVPSTPGRPSVSSPAAGTIRVTWSAPQSNGDNAIAGYVVEISQNSSFSTIATSAEVTGTSHDFTGLPAGNQYWARVYAFNGLRTRFGSAPMSVPLSSSSSATVIQPAPSFISTSPLQAVTIGGSYSVQLSASNTNSFGKVSGDDWINVSSTGLVSGTAPAAAGDYSVTVRAIGAGFTDRTFAIRVNGRTPVWSTAQQLPGATNGSFYSTTVSASASPATVTYSLVDRSNTWVNVSSSGVISGTAAGVGQTTTITVRATSNSLTADRTFSILVAASAPTPVWITDAQLPRGKSGVAYSTSVSAQHAVSYQIVDRPAWVSFNSSIGSISGTPPNETSIKFYNFSITPLNADQTPGPSRTFTITVDPPSPSWTKSALAVTEVVINNNYSDGFTASNVRAASGYSITGLPTGLTFDSNTGAITGSPTRQGRFDVRATAFGLDGTTISTESTLFVFFPGRLISPLGQAVRFQQNASRRDGSSWVNLEFARRWNGSAWIDISN